jgi:quinol monooxygenase YgiN
MFEKKKPFIENFNGCSSLQLMQDDKEANVLYTISTWESPEQLETYRNSELFATTWQFTKTLFNDKPLAYSLTDKFSSSSFNKNFNYI